VVAIVDRMRKDVVSEVVSSSYVSSPHTLTPVTGLTGPLSPSPYCTVLTCMSYQFAQNVETMPPWWVASRYQSHEPSHTHMAARCGGCSPATCHWFMP
jgi:hypothetical protein